MSSGTQPRRRWHLLPEVFRMLAAEGKGAVLLETAKCDDENFRSFLFVNPVAELIAHSREQVDEVFRSVDAYVASGYYVAGLVTYECGYVLQDLSFCSRADIPLIRMAVFRAPIVFDHRTGITQGVEVKVIGRDARVGDDVSILESTLEIGAEDYAKRVGRVRQYLEAGHSYQVNFTDRVTGTFAGTSAALFRHLLNRQPVSYAAYIDCGDYQVLSLSPELFYRGANQSVVVRPMKGTWPRGVNLDDDNRAADALRCDPKNCAEHITIVDLLRNDLGKLSALGSVRVERLMDIERYSTLHQMTSTISGKPAAGKSPSEVFRTLFPSGSITGAPKRRTMEIIRELERNPRGIYTGAIGWFGPFGETCFNVAIRTLVTRQNHFALGVGGGITVDSDPREEYEECQLKASFLWTPQPNFQFIETMRAVSGKIPLLDRHIQRLRESAEYFQVGLDEQLVRRLTAEALSEYGDAELRVRLTLERTGKPAIQCSAMTPVAWTGRVLLSSFQTDASDVFLYHKTSNRHRYDAALTEAQQQGFDEVLFVNQDGFLTEGAISNVFLRIGGELLTPTVKCGILPGVQRAHILDSNPDVLNAGITLSDLQGADRVWVCNALRGIRSVMTISDHFGEILWSQSSLSKTDPIELSPL